MSYSVKPASGWGRLGEGLGQGLAQQLPKEIERNRLSSGLENLGKQDFSQLSPLEIQAKIASIPGMTPEMMQLAYQNLRNQFKAGGSTQGRTFNAPKGAGSPQIERTEPKSVSAFGETTLPKLTEQSSNYGIPKEGEELYREAQELYNSQPSRWNNFEEAEAFVNRLDDKRVQKEQAFENRQTAADKLLNEEVQAITQKQGFTSFKDIPDLALRKFKNEMKNELNKGKTAQQAFQEIEPKVRSLMEARNRLAESMGIKKGFFEGNNAYAKNLYQKLLSNRESYKNTGNLELFQKDLVSQGMGEAYANVLTYPTNQIKGAMEHINSLPTLNFNSQKKKSQQAIAEGMIPYIKEGASIQALALALQKKGYNPQEFMESINNLSLTGPLELLDRQRAELGKDRRLKPTLSDIQLFSKIGLDPIYEAKK